MKIQPILFDLNLARQLSFECIKTCRICILSIIHIFQRTDLDNSLTEEEVLEIGEDFLYFGGLKSIYVLSPIIRSFYSIMNALFLLIYILELVLLYHHNLISKYFKDNQSEMIEQLEQILELIDSIPNINQVITPNGLKTSNNKTANLKTNSIYKSSKLNKSDDLNYQSYRRVICKIFNRIDKDNLTWKERLIHLLSCFYDDQNIQYQSFLTDFSNSKFHFHF